MKKVKQLSNYELKFRRTEVRSQIKQQSFKKKYSRKIGKYRKKIIENEKIAINLKILYLIYCRAYTHEMKNLVEL